MLKYEFNLKLCKLNCMGKLSNWAWLDCVCTDSVVSVSCRFRGSRSCVDGFFYVLISSITVVLKKMGGRK